MEAGRDRDMVLEVERGDHQSAVLRELGDLAVQHFELLTDRVLAAIDNQIRQDASVSPLEPIRSTIQPV